MYTLEKNESGESVSDRLQEHIFARQEAGRPFKCDFEECDKSYSQKHHLIRHKIRSHSLEDQQQEQVLCGRDGCNKTYCNKYVLKQHIDKAHIPVPSQMNENDCSENVANPPVKKKSDIEKRHKCNRPGCDATFYRPYRLKYHELVHHGGEKPFKCDFPECTHNYTSKSHLERHRIVSHFPDKVVPDALAMCEVKGCGKIYKNKFGLKKHTAKKHGDGGSSLNRTIKIEETASEEEIKVDDSDGYAGTDEPYKLRVRGIVSLAPDALAMCEVKHCGKIYTNKFNLKKHTANKHGDGPSLHHTIKTEDTVSEEEIKLEAGDGYAGTDEPYTLGVGRIVSHIPDKVVPDALLMCEVKDCGKIYKTKRNLKRHTALKHADGSSLNRSIKIEDTVSEKEIKVEADDAGIDEPYKCRVGGCAAAFTRTYHLKSHCLNVHSNDRPFLCDYKTCDKSYRNVAHLTRHKTSSHRPEETVLTKKAICGDCGRIFSSKYSLKKHKVRSHTNLPFACTECDEKFKRKSRLRVHKARVHRFEAPYKCNACTKTFLCYSSFNRHLGHHAMHQCNCNELFDKWSKLLKHRNGECRALRIEHKCDVCGKAFFLRQNLTLHFLRVHKRVSEERFNLCECPYIQCKKTYKYRWNLDYHVKSCHDRVSDKYEPAGGKCRKPPKIDFKNRKGRKVKKYQVNKLLN